MSSPTTTSKSYDRVAGQSPLYLSINKLMNKIDENKKLNNDKKLNCNNNYTYYFELDNVRHPINFEKSFILILDGKYMYDNKFNPEQYNCLPIALSVYPGEFLTRDELCKIFNCSNIYITIRQKGKEHILNKNKSLQVIHIPTFPDEFTKDGNTITYYKIWNDNKFNNETAMKKYKDFLNKNKQK